MVVLVSNVGVLVLVSSADVDVVVGTDSLSKILGGSGSVVGTPPETMGVRCDLTSSSGRSERPEGGRLAEGVVAPGDSIIVSQTNLFFEKQKSNKDLYCHGRRVTLPFSIFKKRNRN